MTYQNINWSSKSSRLCMTYPNKKIINDVLIDDKKLIADKFNDFFVNIGPELAKAIPPGIRKVTEYLTGDFQKSMFFTPTTEQEMKDIISNLKNTDSVGHDRIPTKLLKFCCAELSPILTDINNASLQEGVFPDALKIARVTPIHKAGDIKCRTNYRPISVLCALSKISEKVVSTRLLEYLTSNAILHHNQYGFRSQRSTSMALLQLIDDISNAVDQGKFTVGIFIDLAKAFDTVNHDTLLAKLSFYGVRGLPYEWFASYLNNRKQYVSIDNVESHCMYVKCGVPQGSILGPILFLIYINDLNCVSQRLKSIMFADDTNLFISGKSEKELTQVINDELLIVADWFQANLLSLNVKKTSYLIFGNRNVHNLKLNICIQNTLIEKQQETKFLGVILSDDLKWNKHVNTVVHKISKTIGIISKVRHLLPQTSTRTLYLTLVEPYINYCNIVWAA